MSSLWNLTSLHRLLKQSQFPLFFLPWSRKNFEWPAVLKCSSLLYASECIQLGGSWPISSLRFSSMQPISPLVPHSLFCQPLCSVVQMNHAYSYIFPFYKENPSLQYYQWVVLNQKYTTIIKLASVWGHTGLSIFWSMVTRYLPPFHPHLILTFRSLSNSMSFMKASCYFIYINFIHFELDCKTLKGRNLFFFFF